MRRVVRVLVLLFLGVEFAGAEQGRDRLVDEYLEISGLRQQFSQIPGLFRATLDQMAQARGTVSATVRNQLIEAFEAEFDATKLLPVIRSRFDKNLSDDELRWVIAWYQSPLGQRIVQADIAMVAPEAQAAMIGELGKLSSDPDRLGRIEKLEKALQTTELSIEMLAQVMTASSRVLDESSGTLDENKRTEMLKRYRTELAPSSATIRTGVTALLSYGYRDIDINDLDKSIEFVNSKAAHKAILVGTAATIDCIAKATSRVMRSPAQSVAETATPEPALVPVARRRSLLPVRRFIVMQMGMHPSIARGASVWARNDPYQSIADVQYGDIIFFDVVKGADTYVYLWRVVGLPGDKVQVRGEGVSVNGEALNHELVETKDGQRIFIEHHGKASYKIAYDLEPLPDHRKDYEGGVPDGEVFVLGDNRDNAEDSRARGMVKFSSVHAKAMGID